MRLEEHEIKSIAKSVFDLIKPYLEETLKANSNTEPENLYTVNTLSEYLNVPKSWIYKKVQFNEIPYIKVGKYTRFKRSAIIKWIERRSVKAMK